MAPPAAWDLLAAQLGPVEGGPRHATAPHRHAELLGASRARISSSTTPRSLSKRWFATLIWSCDTVGGETLHRSWAVLKAAGRLISIVEEPGRPPSGNLSGMFFIVEPSHPELSELTRLIDAGELRPFVQSVFPLAQTRAAFEQGLAGHLRGKIGLQVERSEAVLVGGERPRRPLLPRIALRRGAIHRRRRRTA